MARQRSTSLDDTSRNISTPPLITSTAALRTGAMIACMGILPLFLSRAKGIVGRPLSPAYQPKLLTCLEDALLTVV